ncbi:Spermine synthase [Channa argus]|uniref:Spermine synthase n=1 Tax=Channa argus TaxID=215402 RepID=A0A6G1QW89_CHAAH|nr:Spermine synthase [Channa argus]
MALRHYTLDFNLSTAVDSASTVPDLLSILHEQEMTETVHDTNGHGYLATFVGKNGRLVILRVHSHGLVTIDLQCYEGDNIAQLDNLLNALEKKLNTLLNGNIARTKRLPALVRGAKVDRYWPTADGRLIEYDIDRVVYEEESAYQNIKILHSQQFGNILVLNGDVNLAESDSSYTQAIMGSGKENYAGKEVLILGGGDGGILAEVVKQKPKMITMVEISFIDSAIKETVTKTCCQLDRVSVGNNIVILVEDCVPVLKKIATPLVEKYQCMVRTGAFVVNSLCISILKSHPGLDNKKHFSRLLTDLLEQALSTKGRLRRLRRCFNYTRTVSLAQAKYGQFSSPAPHSHSDSCMGSYFHEAGFHLFHFK